MTKQTETTNEAIRLACLKLILDAPDHFKLDERRMPLWRQAESLAYYVKTGCPPEPQTASWQLRTLNDLENSNA
jgi:hypothetical protein